MGLLQGPIYTPSSIVCHVLLRVLFLVGYLVDCEEDLFQTFRFKNFDEIEQALQFKLNADRAATDNITFLSYPLFPPPPHHSPLPIVIC